MSVRPWAALPTRARAPNQLGLGLGAGSTRPRPADTNADSLKGFLDLLLHFENYFLSYEANSELMSKVTQIFGLGMIPKHLTSESSRSTWTRNDLGICSKHLDSGSSRALGPRSLSRAHGDVMYFPSTWTQNTPEHRLALPKSFTVLICNVS